MYYGVGRQCVPRTRLYIVLFFCLVCPVQYCVVLCFVGEQVCHHIIQYVLHCNAVRKAVRAGLPEDHFLSQGVEPPTARVLAELRAMDPAAAWERWKAKHGQHCWALHMESGCQRERTCAFLHVEVAKDGDAAANDPSWLQEAHGQ